MSPGVTRVSRARAKRRDRAGPLRARSALDGLAWDNLRLLLALADAGSFRSAAALAGVALNTMRAKIDRLEVQFGTPLLVRSVDGVRLTQEGYELVSIARQMQALGMSASRVQTPGLDRSPCTIRITVTEGIGTFWLVPRLVEFQTEHPEVRVEIHCDMTPPEVLFRDTDIAIQLSRPTNPGMIAQQLGWIHIMPFAAESYLEKFGVPASVAQAAAHKLVWQQSDQIATELIIKLIDPAMAQSMIAVQTNTSSAHFWAVQRGAGIGFLPTYARAYVRNPVPLNIGLRFRPELFLVHHPNAARVLAVRDAIDWLRSAFDGDRYPWFAETFIHPDDFESRMTLADMAQFEGFGAH